MSDEQIFKGASGEKFVARELLAVPLDRLRELTRRKPKVIGGASHMINVSILLGPGYTATCRTCGWSGPNREHYLDACHDRDEHYADSYEPYYATPPSTEEAEAGASG